jgi:hypothetical protein
VRPVLAELVDWASLGKVVYVSFFAGVGVCIAFSLSILGAVRSADHRRADQPVIGAAYTLLSVIGVAACAFAVYHGYLFVVHKS